MTPRVLYMAYGEIGRFCLERLLDRGFEVIGVFCRASDRAERDDTPSVYTAARRAGLHVFAATDPSDPAFLAEARELTPNLLLSVQYDRILKPPLLAIPRHGSYNLHFGPLPRLRGCFPTKWAILEDEPGGVAFHCIDPGIDTGDVIARAVVPLAPGETDETLYGKLVEAGKAVFEEQLGWMRALNPPPALPQNGAEASYHPKQIPFDGVIDWSRDAAWVERFVRAFTFPPYPAAKTWLDGKEIQLRAPVGIGPDLPDAAPGEIVFDNGAATVRCGEGSLVVRTVLVEGREVPVSELVSGGHLLFQGQP
jgi:methionyl-tRNA formyltransferase